MESLMWTDLLRDKIMKMMLTVMQERCRLICETKMTYRVTEERDMSLICVM